MTINEKREILFPVKIVSENKTENSELLTRERKLNITLGDEPLVTQVDRSRHHVADRIDALHGGGEMRRES